MDALYLGSSTGDRLERQRILAFRQVVGYFTVALTLYLSAATFHWIVRPWRPIELFLRISLIVLWLLNILGLKWTQRLDKRLKG